MAVAALSLAVGVVLAESMHELGIRGHALKWPNDVLAEGRKLAGILVEVSGEAEGPATAVIGASSPACMVVLPHATTFTDDGIASMGEALDRELSLDEGERVVQQGLQIQVTHQCFAAFRQLLFRRAGTDDSLEFMEIGG